MVVLRIHHFHNLPILQKGRTTPFCQVCKTVVLRLSEHNNVIEKGLPPKVFLQIRSLSPGTATIKLTLDFNVLAKSSVEFNHTVSTKIQSSLCFVMLQNKTTYEMNCATSLTLSCFVTTSLMLWRSNLIYINSLKKFIRLLPMF